MDPIPTSIIVHWLAIAETTLTFLFNFLTLSNAFFSINDREMKSESGFSLAMASQPFQQNFVLTKNTQITPKLILRQNMCEKCYTIKTTGPFKTAHHNHLRMCN